MLPLLGSSGDKESHTVPQVTASQLGMILHPGDTGPAGPETHLDVTHVRGWLMATSGWTRRMQLRTLKAGQL